MPNFNVFREDRPGNKKGGGSAIFVKNNFSVEKLDWFHGTESIALKIVSHCSEFYVVCLYRSPSLTSFDENEKLLTQISKIPTEPDKNILVVGDLNLPDIDWEIGIVKKPEGSVDRKYAIQSEYLDLFTMKGLKWHVKNEITRIRKYNDTYQKSTLDQIFSNNDILVNSFDIRAPLGKSDHLCFSIELKLENDPEYISCSKKNWYKVDKKFVLERSEATDWNFSVPNLSVQCMWNELFNKMKTITDQVPNNILKTNSKGDILEKVPWDTSKLVRKRKEKDQSWNMFDITPNVTNFHCALHKQDIYAKSEIEAKMKYESKLVGQLKTNPRPYYKYLRSKLKLKKAVSDLKDSTGNLSGNPQDTANILSDFFHSVFIQEEYGPLTKDAYTSQAVISGVMDDLVISECDVKKLLLSTNINKAMGPDEIHPKLINFLAHDDHFVRAITILFNACVQQETIPDIWKSALVVPLHKKGSVHESNNYRPVSLTCILCKIYEKLIREHLLGYVSGIINAKQHGFVPGKSCLSNLLEAIDAVNDFLGEDNCVDILYFDFAKAFDTVSHHRLIVKLEAMGISQHFLNILANFLTGRTMKVTVGNALSESKPVLSGVPQGSVLGPLLFLLYINDLPTCVKSIVKLFADDLKMIVSPYNFANTQVDLDALNLWESKWLLKFNLDKCFVMFLGKNNPNNVYRLSETVLKETKKEKDLGVLFNNKLNFNDAIAAFINKAKSTLFWFLRNTISREPDVMLRAFKCLVRPAIEYCCQAWSPKARHGNWSTILELENVQRLFTRMVKGVEHLPYRERLNKLGLTTLLERRMRGDLIETFKILNNFNNYGSPFFNLSQRTGNLVVRPHKKSTDFFSERVVFFWNKLPEYVKSSTSVNSFKNNVDKFRKNGIRSNLSGQFWELSEEIFRRI